MQTLGITHYFKIGALGLILFLGACAQGRKSATAGLARAQVSETVSMQGAFDDQGNSLDPLGFFGLQIDISNNFVYVDIWEWYEGWHPQDSYRIHVRRKTSNGSVSGWFLLASNLTAPAGSTIEIDALRGHRIYEYVDWIIEMEEDLHTRPALHLDYIAARLQVDWTQHSAYLAARLNR